MYEHHPSRRFPSGVVYELPKKKGSPPQTTPPTQLLKLFLTPTQCEVVRNTQIIVIGRANHSGALPFCAKSSVPCRHKEGRQLCLPPPHEDWSVPHGEGPSGLIQV